MLRIMLTPKPRYSRATPVSSGFGCAGSVPRTRRRNWVSGVRAGRDESARCCAFVLIAWMSASTKLFSELSSVGSVGSTGSCRPGESSLASLGRSVTHIHGVDQRPARDSRQTSTEKRHELDRQPSPRPLGEFPLFPAHAAHAPSSPSSKPMPHHVILCKVECRAHRVAHKVQPEARPQPQGARLVHNQLDGLQRAGRDEGWWFLRRGGWGCSRRLGGGCGCAGGFGRGGGCWLWCG